MKKYLGEIICVVYIIALLAVAVGLTACNSNQPSDELVPIKEYTPTTSTVETRTATLVDKDMVKSIDNYIFWVRYNTTTYSIFVDEDTFNRFDEGDTIVIDIWTKANGNKKVEFAY